MVEEFAARPPAGAAAGHRVLARPRRRGSRAHRGAFDRVELTVDGVPLDRDATRRPTGVAAAAPLAGGPARGRAARRGSPARAPRASERSTSRIARAAARPAARCAGLAAGPSGGHGRAVRASRCSTPTGCRAATRCGCACAAGAQARRARATPWCVARDGVAWAYFRARRASRRPRDAQRVEPAPATRAARPARTARRRSRELRSARVRRAPARARVTGFARACPRRHGAAPARRARASPTPERPLAQPRRLRACCARDSRGRVPRAARCPATARGRRTSTAPPRFVAIAGGALHGRRIVLDPDGGGDDDGGTGPSGTRGREPQPRGRARARRGFLAAAGAEVRLTRAGDFALSDVERVQISEAFHADRFLRIGHRAEPPRLGYYFSSAAGQALGRAHRARARAPRPGRAAGWPRTRSTRCSRPPAPRSTCRRRASTTRAPRSACSAPGALRAEAYALFLALAREWAPDADWPRRLARGARRATAVRVAGAPVTLGGALVLETDARGRVRFARTEPGPIEVEVDHPRAARARRSARLLAGRGPDRVRYSLERPVSTGTPSPELRAMNHGIHSFFIERAASRRRVSLLSAAVGVFLLAGIVALQIKPVRETAQRFIPILRFGVAGPERIVPVIRIEEMVGSTAPLEDVGRVVARPSRGGEGGGATRAVAAKRNVDRSGPGLSGLDGGAHDLIARALGAAGSVPIFQSEELVIEHLVRPRYPEDARDRGVEGKVSVLALVDTLGQVVDAEVMRASGELQLDHAAEAACASAGSARTARTESRARCTRSSASRSGLPIRVVDRRGTAPDSAAGDQHPWVQLAGFRGGPGRGPLLLMGLAYGSEDVDEPMPSQGLLAGRGGREAPSLETTGSVSMGHREATVTARFSLLLVLALACPAAAAAQTLTWRNCPNAAFGEVPAVEGVTFACNGKHDYFLFGTLRLASLLNGVTAVHFDIDVLEEDAATLALLAIPIRRRVQLPDGGPLRQPASLGRLWRVLDAVDDGGRHDHLDAGVHPRWPASQSRPFRRQHRGRERRPARAQPRLLPLPSLLQHLSLESLPRVHESRHSGLGRDRVELSDTSTVTLHNTPDFCATINGGSACATTPVRGSTWRSIKALYH